MKKLSQEELGKIKKGFEEKWVFEPIIIETLFAHIEALEAEIEEYKLAMAAHYVEEIEKARQEEGEKAYEKGYSDGYSKALYESQVSR